MNRGECSSARMIRTLPDGPEGVISQVWHGTWAGQEGAGPSKFEGIAPVFRSVSLARPSALIDHAWAGRRRTFRVREWCNRSPDRDHVTVNRSHMARPVRRNRWGDSRSGPLSSEVGHRHVFLSGATVTTSRQPADTQQATSRQRASTHHRRHHARGAKRMVGQPPPHPTINLTHVGRRQAQHV